MVSAIQYMAKYPDKYKKCPLCSSYVMANPEDQFLSCIMCFFKYCVQCNLKEHPG